MSYITSISERSHWPQYDPLKIEDYQHLIGKLVVFRPAEDAPQARLTFYSSEENIYLNKTRTYLRGEFLGMVVQVKPVWEFWKKKDDSRQETDNDKSGYWSQPAALVLHDDTHFLVPFARCVALYNP